MEILLETQWETSRIWKSNSETVLFIICDQEKYSPFTVDLRHSSSMHMYLVFQGTILTNVIQVQKKIWNILFFLILWAWDSFSLLKEIGLIVNTRKREPETESILRQYMPEFPNMKWFKIPAKPLTHHNTSYEELNSSKFQWEIAT